jgi:hypothetical protein
MRRIKYHRFAGREFRVNTTYNYHHISVVQEVTINSYRTWRVAINPESRHKSNISRAGEGRMHYVDMPKKMEAFIRALLVMKGH